MNKRQTKKLCCPKCGNRMRKFAIRLKNVDSAINYSICKVCHINERKLMEEVMTGLSDKFPILGAFMNFASPWSII